MLNTYRGHSDSVAAVGWPPDGRTIAYGSDNATVQDWDATTGAHAHAYGGHTSGIWSLSWSPDGQRIISAGSYDFTVQVWDPTSGQTLLTSCGHDHWIGSSTTNGVAWSPDGNFIASTNDDATVQVWRP